jgi:hypothetical protein
MPPRRSKHLQEAKLSTIEDLARIASTYSPNGVAESRQNWIMAGSPKSAGSAKPRGISKGQRSSGMQRKARYDD